MIIEFADNQGNAQALDLENIGNKAFNVDCMNVLKKLPDKCFDLAIVDPPYGDALDDEERGGGKSAVGRTGGAWASKYGKKIIAWDIAPGKEYFDELFRVSRNQIIWGGNYFSLPPTRCFLVWRKLTISENFSMAMCEYAWTSFHENAKLFECAPQGTAAHPRIHPTQKPVRLYSWILRNYAKTGDKILDTHLGSGSSRIAAYEMGFDFTGFELDEGYFNAEEKRFNEYLQQPKLL